MGEELGETGVCVSCEKGSYKDTTSGDACSLCSYGYTTATVGATSSNDCNVGVYLLLPHFYFNMSIHYHRVCEKVLCNLFTKKVAQR